MSLKNLLPLLMSCLCLISCSDDQAGDSTNKSSISTTQAVKLISECLAKVKAEQDALAKKERGKAEVVGVHTDESYRSRLPSRSYQSIDQRIKYFERYGTLNLNFAFWGSYRNQSDILIRYVIVRYCSTEGDGIVKTRRSKKIKLT